MVSLSGCVSSNALKAQNPSQLDSLLVRYSDRFDNTKIGMGVSDFLQVWKGAYKNSESTGSVTYGFQFSQTYYSSHDWWNAFWGTWSVKTHEYIQRALFYFSDGRLVKYELLKPEIQDSGDAAGMSSSVVILN